MKPSSLPSVFLFLGALVAPVNVDAYCIKNTDAHFFWSTSFSDLHIPVWVASAGDNSTHWTGESAADVARVVINVISRHNEAVTGPKLYFAGFTDEGLNWANHGSPTKTFIDDLPTGITIMSVECDSPHADVCVDPKAVACANSAFRSSTTDAIGFVILRPGGCSDVEEWSLVEHIDMAQVLLHEFGHVLGLGHSNLDKEECEDQGGIHVGDPAGANGVMHAVVPASFAAYRSWRRDDIEALEFLFGGVPHELAMWMDTIYPDYLPESLATSMVGMSVSRSASIANRTSVGGQVIATTDPTGRVIHRVIDAEGSLTPMLDEIVVDPEASGYSWTLPVAATGVHAGEERIFVAWTSGETAASGLTTVRLATRPMGVVEWDYNDHPSQIRTNRVSMAFDEAGNTVYVMTMTPATAELQVLAFTGDGVPDGEIMTLDGFSVFDVGTPLCEDSRCLVPYGEPLFGGPKLGVAELMIDLDTDIVSLSGVQLTQVDTMGRLSMYEGGFGIFATNADRRFELGVYPTIQPDDAANQMGRGSDWPLALVRWQEVPHNGLIQPRPIICGNGILQADEICDDGNAVVTDACPMCVAAFCGDGFVEETVEQCDDGNNVAGDGCDEVCLIEPMGGEDEIGMTSTEAGGEGEDGCSCDARTPPGGFIMLGFSVLPLLWLRRRTRF